MSTFLNMLPFLHLSVASELTLTERPHSSVKKILEVGVSEAWGFFASKAPTTNHMKLPFPTYEAKKPEVNWI